ncbi:hypothetical protein IFM89_034845 [Coptis chinensis]|uniref:thymidylate synthase n=1 Tax=Coptis chinensis TaxID=261450 RepID=A0A835LJK7_9MAGN|nr:hypothetical protein IFM89_034845 [Coptis chinensis]
MHADYTGQGFDQLLNVIERVKNKPDDRRIILSAWNPADLKLMALPPCHMFAQTFGSFMWPTKSYHVKCIRDLQTWVLVCLSTYVASYAILTCMIARVCACKEFSAGSPKEAEYMATEVGAMLGKKEGIKFVRLQGDCHQVILRLLNPEKANWRMQAVVKATIGVLDSCSP